MTSLDDPLPESLELLKQVLEVTEVQARTYLYLLSTRQATAREVSNACGISRGKVYSVLCSLEARGLIGRTPTSPRSYKALDAGEALTAAQKRFLRLAQDAAKIRDNLPQLSIETLPADLRHAMVMITGRNALASRLRSTLESSKHDVRFLSSDICLKRYHVWMLPILRRKARELASLRILISRGEFSRDLMRSFGRNAHIRELSVKNEGLTACAVDGRHLLVCRWIPDDLSSRGDVDYGILTSDPVFVAFFAHCMDSWWEGARVQH